MQTEWIESDRASFGRLGGFEQEGTFHFFGTRAFSGEELAKIGPAVGLRQVHGDRVVTVKEGDTGGLGTKVVEKTDSATVHDSSAAPLILGEGDALVTNRPGIVLSVITADCAPLLFFDPEIRVIGAAHAGWRGSVKEIASRVVAALAKEYGASPGRLRVAIGPRIGPCCYEVGKEVLNRLRPDRFDGTVSRPARDRGYLDLAALNRLQLMEAGVPPEAIRIAPLCTACRSDRFFSYRRDRGRSGNMISGIMLERP
jgi:YfiH family protein